MQRSASEIGAFEAKTRLSELLRETERGSSFVILRRGRPVARLVPIDEQESGEDLAALRQAFRSLRQQVKGPVDVGKLVEEGRRR